MENTTNIPQGLYEDFNHFENPSQQVDDYALNDFEIVDKTKYQDQLTQSEQQKHKNPDILQLESSIEQISLWARNKRIQNIVQEPILPLVLLLGPQQVATSIQKIILDQMKIQRQQTGNNSSQNGILGVSSQNLNDLQETSRHNLRIKSYDFFSTYRTPTNLYSTKELPSFYKEQLNGTSGGLFKKSNQKDIGYLKRRFFDSISIFKPAVTIFIFDPPQKLGFEWSTYENQIIEELKVFQEKCSITAKQTKIIILVFVPQTAADAEKSQTSLRRAIDQLSSASSQNTKDTASQNASMLTTNQLINSTISSVNSSMITTDDKIIMQSFADQAFQLLLNVKAVMVHSQGIEGLKKNPKDLIKKVTESTNSYYAEKKRNSKNLEKKLVRKDQTQRVRYQFKIGIYSLLSKSDIQSGLTHTKLAYDDLRIGMGPGVALSRQAFEQRRENADIIMIQMLVYLLDQKEYDTFIRQFEAHLHCWKNQFEQIKNGSLYQSQSSFGPGGIQTSPAPLTTAGINQQITQIILKVEELKWRSNWHLIIAQMLNTKPILFNPSQNIYQKQNNNSNKQSSKGEHVSGCLLTDTLVESYFSGQHYLNCFFSLIKRKNDLLDFVNNFKIPENDDQDTISWLEKELADIIFLDNNKMVGTDYELVKKSNPLNPLADSLSNSQFGLGQGLSSALTQVGLDKHKLLQQLKGIDNLNKQILRIGQLALSSYNTKNQLMTQNELEGMNNQKLQNAVSTSGQFNYLRSQCRRKIQSIQFHISSHIFQLYQENQSIIKNNQSILGKLYEKQQIFEDGKFELDRLFFPDILLLKEAQKYRDSVSNQMIKAGWNEQGIAILERSRDIQETLCKQSKKFEDFMLYELKILNFSPSISRDELNKRFLLLIKNQEQNFQEQNPQDDQIIVGELEGAKLIWARAQFSTKMGQDVQVNSWVKLTIEIFTRIKNPLNSSELEDLQAAQSQEANKKSLSLKSVQLQFNSQQFDFTINEDEQTQLEIMRGKPLVLEKNIFLNEDVVYNALKSNQKNQIYIDSVPVKIGTRNSLNLILEKVKIQFKNSPLQLIMQPYLIAKDKIQSHIERKGAGLKLPVQLNIKDMQPMVSFDLGQQDKSNSIESVVDNHLAYQETLIGNSQKIDICIKKEDIINLKHLSLIIEKVLIGEEEKNKTIFEQPQRRSAIGGLSDIFSENKEAKMNEQYQIKYQLQDQPIEDLDYPNNKKVLFTQKCLESITNKFDNQNIHLKLFFTFYEPAMNKVKLRFKYNFTKTHYKNIQDSDALFAHQDHNIDLLGIQDQENQDLQRVESNEFQQDYYALLKIRSISPIQVEWKVIRQTDHYLNALEYELNIDQQLKNNENSKIGLKKSMVDQKQTEMRVSLNQIFKIACKITNVAKYRSISLIQKNIQLTLPHVNLLLQNPPDSEDQTLPAQNADFSTVLEFLKRTCLKQLNLIIEGDEEVLAPSESMTLITKDLNLSYELMDWLYENQDVQMQLDNILQKQNGVILQEEMPIVDDVISLESQKQLEKLQRRRNSRVDSNSKIKKTASNYHNAFVVQSPFQLNLKWKEDNQEVFCEMESRQSLHLIKVAIEAKIIVGSEEQEEIKLYVDNPVEVIYKIKNISADKIFKTLVLVDNTYYMFYVCGDVKKKIDLLPLQEIELRYTLIPLKPGICNLPNLHVFDRIANPDIIDLQPRNLNNNEWVQEHPKLAYLAKSVTKRVFVVQ